MRLSIAGKAEAKVAAARTNMERVATIALFIFKIARGL